MGVVALVLEGEILTEVVGSTVTNNILIMCYLSIFLEGLNETSRASVKKDNIWNEICTGDLLNAQYPC